MNRIHTAISAAVLATSMAGGVVLAGDAADKQPATGQQATQADQQGENLGAGPNVRELDSNAQRAHSPTGQTGATTDGERMGAGAPDVKDLDNEAQRAHDPQTGAAAGGANASTGTQEAGTTTGGGANGAASGDTRDWAQVDANSDNLISPDEMEAALQEKGPQAGQR